MGKAHAQRRQRNRLSSQLPEFESDDERSSFTVTMEKTRVLLPVKFLYVKVIDHSITFTYNSIKKDILYTQDRFYKGKNDIEPVKEYILSLAARTDKDSRIKLNKIQDYVQILAQYGMRAGGPYIKHIDGEIWELRPLRDGILFFCWLDDTFVLLHHFVKKTQKTPKREIERAKKNMVDFIERSDDDEQE